MRALFLIFSVVVLANCAHSDSSPSPVGGASMGPQRFTAPVNSTPGKYLGRFDFDQVSLNCAQNEKCPEGVGVLMFESPGPDAEHVYLDSCTASLTAGNKILTAGHCPQFESATVAYFFTRSDMPGGRQFRQVVSVGAHVTFTPGPPKANPNDEQQSSGQPDVALLSLASPIDNLRPMSIEDGAVVNISQARAWVVEKGGENAPFAMTLAPLDCVIHPDAKYFPFELTDLPDMIYGYKCEPDHGNSGAALLANNKIIGVVNGASLNKNFKLAEITNVRCLDYLNADPKTCVDVEREIDARALTIEDKFNATIKPVVEYKLEAGAPFAWKRLLYPLANKPHAYQILYEPICHSAKWNKKSISIYTQNAYKSYDEWHFPRLALEGVRVENRGAVAQEDAKDHFVTNWIWAQAPLQLLTDNGGADLRTSLGVHSTIAIPTCPR